MIDPANPQPHERYVSKAHGYGITVLCVGKQKAFIVDDDDQEDMVSLATFAECFRPAPRPLTTEPVTLHHWRGDDGRWGLSQRPADPAHDTLRTFTVTPKDDGSFTLREVGALA